VPVDHPVGRFLRARDHVLVDLAVAVPIGELDQPGFAAGC
jgi:hypothetical protein